MHRAIRIGLKALPWLGMAGLAYLALHNAASGWWDLTSDAHGAARQGYFADLSYEGCVRQDAVIAQAEARDWRVEVMAEPLHWCHTPRGLSGWVYVDVSPPLPFSSEGENAAYIGFDDNGCMARWTYDSGPNSTCAGN